MTPNPTQLLLRQFALIGQALSNPFRLMMIQLLCQGEKSVEALAQATAQSIASASAHLKVLRSACLVESHKRGRFVYYRLASPRVMQFWLALRQLGEERLPEAREVIRAYFDDPENQLHLTPRELLQTVRGGRIILLDVRPPDEYAAGHIPDARSIPIDELESRIRTLPSRKPLAVYCRGPYCVTAIDAVKRLQHLGRNALRLPLGIAEWQAAGLSLQHTQ